MTFEQAEALRITNEKKRAEQRANDDFGLSLLLSSYVADSLSTIEAGLKKIPPKLYKDNPTNHHHQAVPLLQPTPAHDLFLAGGLLSFTAAWERLSSYFSNPMEKNWKTYVGISIDLLQFSAGALAISVMSAAAFGAVAFGLIHAMPFIMLAVAGVSALVNLGYFVNSLYKAMRADNWEDRKAHLLNAAGHIISLVIDILAIVTMVKFLLPMNKQLAHLVSPTNFANKIKDLLIMQHVGSLFKSPLQSLMSAMLLLTGVKVCIYLFKETKKWAHDPATQAKLMYKSFEDFAAKVSEIFGNASNLKRIALIVPVIVGGIFHAINAILTTALQMLPMFVGIIIKTITSLLSATKQKITDSPKTLAEKEQVRTGTTSEASSSQQGIFSRKSSCASSIDSQASAVSVAEGNFANGYTQAALGNA